MDFWSARALYVRTTHNTLSKSEWDALRALHFEEFFYHCAKLVSSIAIAFFNGLKEGVISVPSGLTLWQIMASGGAIWTLSPMEIEQLVKGIVLDPYKYLKCTAAVLVISGLLGGVRSAFHCAKQDIPILSHHLRGYLDPRKEALSFYEAIPKTDCQTIYLALIKPFEWTESLIPPLACLRARLLPI